MISYAVRVRTGNQPAAGTAAKVFLTMLGTKEKAGNFA